MRPLIKAFGCPMLPNPPSSTTEPSRMPAMASTIDDTILSIIRNAFRAFQAKR
jgi:hypothetical protein